MLPPRPRLKQCFLINFFSNQFSFIVLKMGTNCAFHGCVSQYKNNAQSIQKISLHKLPKVQPLRETWLQLILRTRQADDSFKQLLKTDAIRICSNHFISDNYIFKRDAEGGKCVKPYHIISSCVPKSMCVVPHIV